MEKKELTKEEKEILDKIDVDELLLEKLKKLELYSVNDDIIRDSGLAKEEILEIRKTYLAQKLEKKEEGGGWTFWDERVQVENLLCQRFNFLILSYSLFIAAFAVIPDKLSKIILLFLGFVVMLLLSIFVRRAWSKLDFNLKCLFVLHEEYNGIRFIDQKVRSKKNAKKKNDQDEDKKNGQEGSQKKGEKKKLFSIKYNKIIGAIIPGFLCISLALGIIAIALGWWDGGAKSDTTTTSHNNTQVIQSTGPSIGQPTYNFPNNSTPMQTSTSSTPSFNPVPNE